MDTDQLIKYTLHLADTHLVLAQRNAEWCAHGPILEQDIAITNISLDLIGQARNFYQYAASLINHDDSQIKLVTEDSLAYLRTERKFKNLLITELPSGDWAQTILRQFFFCVFQLHLFEQIKNTDDKQLSAIAEKAIKENKYHVKWSSEWVLRLGDGTAESHKRMQDAIINLWPYTGEFFVPADYEHILGLNFDELYNLWITKVRETITAATLQLPQPKADKNGKAMPIFMHTGGKHGVHTEHLGFILAEMQSLQRTYPGAEW